jgi:hypothetical protein
VLAVVSSAIYFLSDALEASNGGFTNPQLLLTLVAEATLPIFVLGLSRLYRGSLGSLGRFGAGAYALAHVYFTYTVVYALAHDTADFAALNRQLSPWMTIAGGVMVVAGVAFGAATFRAQTMPRWTGVALIAGVVLVVLTIDAPSAIQLFAVAIRDVAFAGMGVAILRAQDVLPLDASRPALESRSTSSSTSAHR